MISATVMLLITGFFTALPFGVLLGNIDAEQVVAVKKNNKNN